MIASLLRRVEPTIHDGSVDLLPQVAWMLNDPFSCRGLVAVCDVRLESVLRCCRKPAHRSLRCFQGSETSVEDRALYRDRSRMPMVGVVCWRPCQRLALKRPPDLDQAGAGLVTGVVTDCVVVGGKFKMQSANKKPA